MSHFDLNFYKNKKVLITGHTGFKGSWLCRMLLDLGADVTGYSLEPPTDPSLFRLADLGSQMHSVIGDIRDLGKPYESIPDHKAGDRTSSGGAADCKRILQKPCIHIRNQRNGNCKYPGMHSSDRFCKVFPECNYRQGLPQQRVGMGIS